MSFVDVVVAVLGLGLFGIGAFQVTTGRNLTSRQQQPTSMVRAGGAMFLFLGLAVAWNADLALLDHTTHGIIAVILGACALASAFSLLVLWLRGARR